MEPRRSATLEALVQRDRILLFKEIKVIIQFLKFMPSPHDLLRTQSELVVEIRLFVFGLQIENQCTLLVRAQINPVVCKVQPVEKVESVPTTSLKRLHTETMIPVPHTITRGFDDNPTVIWHSLEQAGREIFRVFPEGNL